VVKVAFHFRFGLEGDGFCANGARHFAVHQHLLAGNQSRYLPLLSDNDLGSLHVTLDFPVNLENSTAYDLQPLPDNPKVIAND